MGVERSIAIRCTHPPTPGVAASYSALGLFGDLPPTEAFADAARYVERALELDSRSDVGHEVLGAIELFHRWDWASAGRALERALEINPNNAGARDLISLLAIVTGRPDDAILEITKACDVDPLSSIINTDLGYVYYYARRFEPAAEQLLNTLELEPWFAHARRGLGYVYLQQGRLEEALDTMRTAVEHSGRHLETSADLGYAFARAGNREQALAIRQRMIDRRDGGFVDPYAVAQVSVGLEEWEDSLVWLNAACDARSRELIYLGADPVFDPLRSHPQFREVLDRIGLQG